ncbi:hypothetical protein QE152_g6462 [Popillia japonica]|uniref:Uncharacterized protein n=1 Tax=Popillia japonica TaxID=7064 RepID=A0AAW1MIJ5_POPJA
MGSPLTVKENEKRRNELNQQSTTSEELNGFINNSPIYVTSLTATESINNNPTVSKSGNVVSTTIVSAKEVVQPQQPQIQQQQLLAASNNKLLPTNQTNGHEYSSSGDIILTQQFVDTATTINRPSTGKELNSRVPNDVRVAAPSITSSSSVTATTPVELQRAKTIDTSGQVLDVRKLGDRRASSPFQNGRTEMLIGADDNKLKTTAIVENNNNKLGLDQEIR